MRLSTTMLTLLLNSAASARAEYFPSPRGRRRGHAQAWEDEGISSLRMDLIPSPCHCCAMASLSPWEREYHSSLKIGAGLALSARQVTMRPAAIESAMARRAVRSAVLQEKTQGISRIQKLRNHDPSAPTVTPKTAEARPSIAYSMMKAWMSSIRVAP